MGKHQKDNNKPQRHKDGSGWKRLSMNENNELEIFRLNFSRFAKNYLTPLMVYIEKLQ